MKYVIDGTTYYSIDEVLDHCIEDDYHEDDSYFEEWVNDIYGKFEISGDDYYAYDILQNMNTDMLSDLKDDYCETENESDRDNARYELERADDGEIVYIQNYSVYCEEEKEEEVEETIESHEAKIEAVRVYIEEQNLLHIQAVEEEKKVEDDIMSLFQVIS